MLPSSNDYASSKSLLSSSTSPSHSSLSAREDPHGTRGAGGGGKLSSQQIESDVTAETSLADSEPAYQSSSVESNALKLDKVNPAFSSSSSSRETSYPSDSVSSSRGISSSESFPGDHHRHRHHHHGQKSKQLRKVKPDAHSTVTTSSSASSDSGSISPCPSSVSSTSSLNENNQPRKSVNDNLNHLYHKRGDGGGRGSGSGSDGSGKRFKIFNFLKIKPSGMTKSKTVDQIKCICRDEKKFDCLKCTSNYPVHVNRSKDGEEDRGARSSVVKLQRHDQSNGVHSNETTSAQPANQSILSSLNSSNKSRPPLVVSVPVRRADGSNNSNSNNNGSNSQHYNRMVARRTIHELHEHQSMMPNSKTFSNFTSLNPVPNAIKLKPSPFPVSNQLMSFLEQLNPSNSFKVPPNVSPFT